MKHGSASIVGLVTALLVAGCADVPMAPEVATWAGPGKSDDAFRDDKTMCRQYASRPPDPSDQGGDQVGRAEAANRVRVSGTQMAFDDAYATCMSAKGDQVAGAPMGTVHDSNFMPGPSSGFVTPNHNPSMP